MNKNFIKSVLTGAVVGAGALIVLALIGALLVNRSADPDKLIPPAAYVSLFLSSFIGGAVASRAGGYGGVGAAAFCGVLLAVAHLIVRVISGGGLSFFPLVAVYAAMVLLSTLAGLLFRRRASRSASRTVKKFKRLSRRARG